MGEISYQTGFGNQFATEAEPDILPTGQNSPQKVSGGLYTEQLTGTAFTRTAGFNAAKLMYRMRPSVRHLNNLQAIDSGPSAPVRIRTHHPPLLSCADPFPSVASDTTWLTGLATVATNGNSEMRAGGAVHHFVASQSMGDTAFVNTDGELMLVPYDGQLSIKTEMGHPRLTQVTSL